MKTAKQRHEICPLASLPPGERTIVAIGKRSIGIFNVHGSLYAVKNQCPHQGAELCRGTVGGTMLPTDKPGEYRYDLDGQVLRCPWHFWEFDLTTGEMIFVPEPQRVKMYDVTVEQTTAKKETGGNPSETYTLDRYSVEVEDDMVVLYL